MSSGIFFGINKFRIETEDLQWLNEAQASKYAIAHLKKEVTSTHKLIL